MGPGTPLPREEFFTKLAELFEETQKKNHGAVHLTQKRMTYSPNSSSVPGSTTDPLADLHLADPVPVLIRATNARSKKARAHKVKLSTLVQPEDLDAFYIKYAEICKAGTQALKKRDRSKKKAKKRKGGAEGEKKS